MEVSRDTRTREGYNDVAGCKISYSIVQRTGDRPSNISTSITTKDEQTGNAQLYADGKVYITIQPGMSYEDIKLVIDTILTDASAVFNEPIAE